MSSDVRRAEWGLYRRTGLACAAAMDAGVPGRFRTWDRDGVLAVLATDPALGFLSTVSGITRETLTAATDLVHEAGWNGVQPTVLVPAAIGAQAEAVFAAAGLARGADRMLAVKRLAPGPASTADPEVVDADADDSFLRVLLAGYQVDGTVAAFIRAEHRHPAVLRLQVVEGQTPIAAAAMTIHDDVAVLGGASTLPEHRGKGAQSRLLRHRLRMAAAAGCTLAVATARPDSVSAGNLRRAGFDTHRRLVWAKA